MKTKSVLSPRWFASLSLFAVLLALPLGAGAQTYTQATNLNSVFSAPSGWVGLVNPPSGGGIDTTIIVSHSGTQFVTNDYAGKFVLNSLVKNTGVWTVSAMNGGFFEFTNNSSSVGPTIYGTQSGNAFTVSAPLQLDNDTTVTNNSSTTLTLSGAISGVGGLIVQVCNASGVTLTGGSANTYSGNTAINGGGTLLLNKTTGNAIAGNITIGNGTGPAILKLSAATQIADTSILTFGNGGVFRLNGNFDTIGGIASLSGNGLIENSNATSRTLTVNLSGADQSFSGIIQNGVGAGTLALTKAGANTQTLTGVNTYTGGTIVSGGTLALSGSGSIDGSFTITVQTNATLKTLPSGFIVSSGHNLRGAGSITNGMVMVASGGSLTPGDPNVTAGTMTLDALTLSSGCTNNFEFSPATNDLVNVTTSGGLTLSGGVFNLYITNSTTPFITLGTYNLIQYAGSTTSLDSTWTTVSSSNPHIANPQSGLVYSFGTSGGYLQVTIGISASTVFWNVDASASWNNNLNWTPTTIPNAPGATASFGGGGTPTTAFRAVALDANQTVGTLSFSSPNSFEIDPNGAFSLTLNNSANPAQINAFAGTSNNVTAPLALVAGVTVNAAASTVVALNGNISGTGGLTNSGLGTLALGGANTYSVGTIQNSGTLALNNAGALGAGALTISGGFLDNTSGTNVTLASSGAQYWNATLNFTGTTNLNLGTGAVTMSANRTVNVLSNNLTVGSVISGSNTLTKSGSGQLTLSGNNTFTNTTTVSAGTLSLNAAGGALPSGNTIAVNNIGSTLDVAQNQTIATLNIAFGATISGAATLTVTNIIAPNIAVTNINNISVALAGAAQLKKTGGGTTILSGANTYTGGTWITGNAGNTLLVTNGGTLGSVAGTLNVDPSTILDLGGTSQTVGSVSIGGMITNGTLTGTSFTVTNGTVYANLGGSGAALTKSGPNTAILAGANTYSGATTISAGTLQVDGSTVSASALALNGGTLSGKGTVGGSVTEASGASIAPGDNNVGTLTITGNLTLNGGGTLNIAATNTSNFSKITVQGNLNPSGVTTVVLPAAPLPNGNYPLIGVYGTLGGSAANFSVASVSPRTYTIVYQAGSPNTVVLQVTTPVLLTWIGDGFANEWNTTDGGDWVNPPPTPATYTDGNSVLFDDTAAITTVNLPGTVSPLAMTVNASTNNYTITGAGSIGGAATLNKLGTSTLTINTANAYTGVTTISGGTLSISADNALGTPPGTPTPGQLVLNGGTLSSAGLTLDVNRGIAVGPPTGSGSGTINAGDSGSIACPDIIANNATGKGTLIVGPVGTGYVILSGTNTYTGGSWITNGILELQNDQSAANGGFVVGYPNISPCYLQIDGGATVVVASGNSIQVGPPNTGITGNTKTSTVFDLGVVTNNGSLFAGRVSQVTIKSGGLWVQSGNMTVQAFGNLGANLLVELGGTFIYNGASAIQLNGPGTTFATKGILTISGTFITSQGFTNAINTQTTGNGWGAVTIAGGTLQLTASVPNLFAPTTNAIGGIHCNLTAVGNGATIDTGVFTATNYVAITGAGALTKLGSGKLVMAGTNTYSGNTTVGAGTLAIQQPSLNTNSTITVSNSAVLQLDFAVTNPVTALVLNGVTQPAGVYNSSTPGGFIAGTGSLVIPAAPSTEVPITFNVSSGVLTLNWPGANLGWFAQSNSVSIADPGSWFDITGSDGGTSLSITMDPTKTNVFYRLRAP